MQTISTETQAAIEAGKQVVIPRVTAEWLNSRFVENVVAFTTSDNYVKKTKEMEPDIFWQLSEPDYATKIHNDHPLANLWMLNETSGSTIIDYNGILNGTTHNSPTLNDDSIITGGSILFDGTNDYISVPQNIRYSPGYLFGFMTLEAWVKPVSVSAATIMGKGDVDVSRIVDDGYEWKFGFASSKLYFKIMEPDGTTYVIATGDTTITTDTWHHVVATWDGKAIKLYLDGQFEKSAKLTDGFRINMPYPNTSDVNIGRMSDTTGYFHGNMNAVAIYNTILPPSEIVGHYNIGIGKTYDSSGNARSGNLVNAATDVIVKDNTEVALNRLLPVNRWVPDFSGDEYFVLNGLAGSADFTAEAWIKTVHPGSGLTQTIFAKGAQSPGLVMQFGIDVVGTGASTEQFVGYVDNAAGTRFDISTGGGDLTTGWHYCAITVNNNVLIFYVDGISQGTPTTITGTRSTATYPLTVARYGAALDPQAYTGKVMNVAYYPTCIMDATQAYVRYLSAIRGSVDSKNFGPSFMTGDEVINGHYGYGHVWTVLGGQDRNGSPINLSSNYDVAEDTTQDKTYKYEYGWWGNNKTADDSFYATNDDELVLTFSEIECNAIGIYSPSEFGGAKEIDVSYRDDSNVWQYTGTWEFVDEDYIIIHLNEMTAITGLDIDINSTKLPNDYATISEITPLVIDDVSEDVVTLSIQKTRENFDSSVPFGATAANSADIVLQNVDLRYNPNNVDSDIYGLLTPDTKFKVELGWENGGGPNGLHLTGTVGGRAESLGRAPFYLGSTAEVIAHIAPNTLTPTAPQAIIGVARTGVGPLTPDTSYSSYTPPTGFDDFSGGPVTEYGSGTYLVGGGNGNTQNFKFWIFDPTDQSFTPITDSPHKGYGTASTVAGVAYVWQDRNVSNLQKQMATYDGTWHVMSQPPQKMWTSVAVGTDIYVTDFNQGFWRYNTLDDTYTALDDIPIPGPPGDGFIYDFGRIVEYGGDLYLIIPEHNGTSYGLYVQKYVIGVGWDDPDSRSPYASDNAVDFFSASVVDGRIYVAGGYTGVTPFTSNQTRVYDISSDAWSIGPNMPSHLAELTSIYDSVNATMWVFGGWDDDLSDYVPGTALGLTFVAGGGTVDLSWRLMLNSDASLLWCHSSDGATETADTSTDTLIGKFAAGTSGYVKTVTTGGTNLDFYFSDDGITWTQLGTTVSGSFSLWTGESDLEVGSSSNGNSDNFIGTIYSAEVRNNGFLSANPNFTSQPLNIHSTSFIDDVGNKFTIHSPASLNAGGVEYIPQGTFYADTFQVDSSGMTNEIACRDKSKFMQENTKDTGLVFKNLTAAEAVSSIAKEAGVLNSEISYDLPYSQTIIRDNPISYWDFNQIELDRWTFHFNGSTKLVSNTDFYMNRGSRIDNDVVIPQIEFYIKTSGDTGDIFKYVTVADGERFKVSLGTESMVVSFDGTDSDPVDFSGGFLTDNKWHYIQIMLNDAANTFDLFIDGFEWATSIALSSIFSLGDDFGTITIGEDFTGYLSGVRLSNNKEFEDILEVIPYPRSRHGSTDYGKEYSTLAYFPLSEGSGNIAYSATDFFNNLVVTGTTSWVKQGVNTLKDKAGWHHGTVQTMNAFNQTSPIISETSRTYKFDGTAANIVYISDSDDFTLTNSFSVEAIINQSDLSVNSINTIFDKFDMQISINNTRHIVLSGDSFTSIVSTGTITYNTWQHIVVSVDNLSVTFYIDGSVAGTGTMTFALSNPDRVSIGGQSSTVGCEWTGYMASVVIYGYPLDADQVTKHRKSMFTDKPKTFGLLWAQEDTLWDNMLTIALADLGMFNIDENGIFRYESALAFYNAQYPQHSVVQYHLDEDTNIISGSQNIELLINKVIVTVNPIQSLSNSTTEIWNANSGESLAATTLTSALAASQSGSGSSLAFSATVNSAGVLEPIFPVNGFVRVGDEIIKYDTKDDFHLYGLTRGMFHTSVGSYGIGEFVGEAREYNLEWSNSPVIMVKYPFITAQSFDGTVEINLWNSNPTSGHLVISLTSGFDADDIYQILQGNNPITGLDNFFAIAGIPAIDDNAKGTTSEVSSDYAQKIRRYGLKDMTIDNPFIQDTAYAKQIADFVLLHNSNPVKVITINTIGLPHLQLSDRIEIDNFAQLSISGLDYWIMNSEIQYDGGVTQTLTLKQVD